MPSAASQGPDQGKSAAAERLTASLAPGLDGISHWG